MIFILAFAAGLALQAVSPEVARHAQAGLDAEKQGRLIDAIAEFKQVTEMAPDFTAGFVNLGAAYIQDRNYAAAVPPLKTAVKMNENLAGAQQMLGYALLMEGDAQGAIPHLERAGAKDFLGIAQLKVGKLPEAVENLNAAVSKHPNSPELLYYLGRAAGLLSKEVMDTLDSAFPDSSRSHQALGENYAALKQAPKAEKEYLQAIRLQPNARGVHLDLGLLYASLPDWSKAEDQFRAEAQLEPADAEAAYRLGHALLEEGKIHEAQAELKRADRLRPDMPQTLYSLGKAESLNGDSAAAENSWKRVIVLEKTSALAAQAHFALATLYRKQGRAADARRELREYERLQNPLATPEK
ncbi:MAG: tetratricopeptide repeat protein [Bryobacteraceae bacterium]